MHVFIALVHAIVHEQKATCMIILEQDGLLPFLGQAICWSQSCPNIVEGFLRRSDKKAPYGAIIDAVHSIGLFLSQEYQNFGIPAPKAFEMLKTIGTVTTVRGSELPAIVGMIRSYGEMCQRQALDKVSSARTRERLSVIITALIWGGCVDETVMKELSELHGTCPEFVVRCASMILCLSDSRLAGALSDSRFAGALRSGLLATTLSICAQLGLREIQIRVIRNASLESSIRADALASGIIDDLYKIHMHHKTHMLLRSMKQLNFPGMEAKLGHIVRGAQDSVCANCLETFDREALKWCKGTHMLEPFCSKECLRKSWEFGICADFSDIVQDDDDTRLISLKRNILKAGSIAYRDSIERIVCERGPAIALGQEFTMTIDLREFPHRVSSGLLTSGDTSGRIQVTIIAEDFRGGVGKVLELKKSFPILVMKV